MKKPQITATALLLTAALLLSGCSKQNDTSLPDTDSGNSSELSDSSNSSSDNSGDPDNSESSDSTPEPPKPDGEPTFLICPDGTPVYTSEISEIYAGSEFDGNLETLTLEQAERRAEECEGEFNVKCEGFAYGFIPERALNHIDDPELFKDFGDGVIFDFLGDEDKISTDYMRIKVGDKFGTLTVKSAYTLFSNNRWLKEISETPGAYISGGALIFDGEVELTGYIDVWEGNPDYPGSTGIMVFYPDGGSSVKIPAISYEYSEDGRKGHRRTTNTSSYFGDWVCDLGNMYEVDCDTSGLHPGDNFVKVKITADNVNVTTIGQGGVRINLRSIELL